MPTRTSLSYTPSRGLKSRTPAPIDLEFQAAAAFAVALGLGAAALTLSASIAGAAALLLLAALVARAALNIVAADPAAPGSVRPRRQSEFDATLAVALGLIAVILAAVGDYGAAGAAAIGAALLGLLQLRTRYLTR